MSAKSSIFTNIKEGSLISKSVKTIEKDPSILIFSESFKKIAFTVFFIFFPWKSNSPIKLIFPEVKVISSE